MNEFLNTLARNLKHMSLEAKDDILQDYREHFQIGLSNGKTEKEIAEALGDPKLIAKMYSASNAADRAVESSSIKDAFRMMGAIISYKVGGGLLIAVLYIACVSIMLSLFAAAISLIITGGALLALTIVYISRVYVALSLLALFTMLIFISGGALFYIGNLKLWHLSVGNLPKLARNLTRIRGQEEYDL